MTGGTLQLVAKGVDDLFLIGDPEITFFKTVYRRHTNFTRQETSLNFNSRLSFGKQGRCRLGRKGDLLHRLILQIKTPEVDIRYRPVDYREMTKLLMDHEISWTPDTNNLRGYVTEDDVDVINLLIDQKVTQLESSITSLENTVTAVDAYHATNSGDSASDYRDGLIDILITDTKTGNLIDQLGVEKAAYTHHTVDNAESIKKFVTSRFREYAIDDTETEEESDKQTHIDNFTFYDQLNRKDVVVTRATENTTSTKPFFDQLISDLYQDDDNEDYKDLDAFKMFDKYLTDNDNNITTEYDIQAVKSNILNNITWNIGKNTQLAMKVVDSLTQPYSFILYRRFKFDPATSTWNTGEAFINVSTSTTTVFDDNFTTFMKLIESNNEPTEVSHAFSSYVNSNVLDFHIANRTLFREDNVHDYFSNLDLWSKTNITSVVTVDDNNTKAKLGNIYLLNFLPLSVLEDIQNFLKSRIESLTDNSYNQTRILEYLANNVGTISDTDHWEDLKGEIRTALCEGIGDEFGCAILDTTDITNLVNLSSAYKSSDRDVLMVGLFKRYPKLDPGDGGATADIFTYTIRKILKNLEDSMATFVYSGDSSALADIEKQLIRDLTNTYQTSSDNLPLYEDYTSTYTIYDTNQKASEFLVDPLLGSTNTVRYMDASYSIWTDIFSRMITNFNGLFNNNLLNPTYYQTSLGKQIYDTLMEIHTDHFSIDAGDTDYDFYYIDTAIVPGIVTLLRKHLNIYIRIKASYDNNDKLLSTVNHHIPRKTLLFGTISDIVTNITDYLDGIYGAEAQPAIIDTVANAILSGGEIAGVNYVAKLAPGDVFTILRADDDIMDIFDVDFANDALYKVTVGLIASDLHRDFSVILNDFAELGNSSNIFDYLIQQAIEYIIEDASFLGSTNQGTYAAFSTMYQSNIASLQAKLDAIKTDSADILKDTVASALKTDQPAKFAWSTRLVHAMIDEVRVVIGGQTVQRITGEWIEFDYQTSRNEGHTRGHNIMTGNIPEMYTFDTKKKRSKQMYVMLPLSFCKDVGNSLPMVALNHTEVSLYVKLKDLDQVAYWEPLTYFRKRLQLDCSVTAEYLYVEQEERLRLSKMKHEYLMETVQCMQDLEIDSTLISEENIFDYRLYFENPSKEIIWVFQDISEIDGSLPNGQRNQWNYLIDSGYGYQTAELMFNGRWREEAHIPEWFNFVMPHSRHTGDLDTGISCYSFALKADALQPTGSANLSRIDNFTIRFILPASLVTQIKNGRRIQVRAYSRYINVMRIMSGMAGLAFYSS